MLAFNNTNFSTQTVQHKGHRRQRQEDHILASPTFGLFAVADGMGGHEGGNLASFNACTCLHDLTGKMVQRPINQIAQALPHEFIRRGQPMGKPDMGTTLSALWFRQPNKVEILHWGDSRIYSIDTNGNPIQITQDHVAPHPAGGNYVSRALTMKSSLPGDAFVLEAPRGCVFLICSDGFYKYFSQDPESMKAILTEPNGLELGMEQVLARGADDNLSAVRITIL